MKLILISLSLLINSKMTLEKKVPYLLDMFPKNAETDYDLENQCNITSIRDDLCSRTLFFNPCKVACLLDTIGLIEDDQFSTNKTFEIVKENHPEYIDFEDAFHTLMNLCNATQTDEDQMLDHCTRSRSFFYCIIQNMEFGNFWGISEDCYLTKYMMTPKSKRYHARLPPTDDWITKKYDKNLVLEPINLF